MKSRTEKNILKRSFRFSVSLLNRSQKWGGIIIVILLLINSFLDVFTIASVLPLVVLLLSPQFILSNKFLKSIYDIIGFNSSTDFFIAATCIVILLFIIKNIVSYFIFHYQSKYAFSVSARLSKNMIDHFYTLPYLTITNSDTSIYLNRIVNTPASYVSNILLSLFTIFSEGLIFILISTGLLIYNYNIFLLLLLVLTPGTFLYFSVRKKKLSSLNNSLKSKLPEVLKLATEAIKGFVESTLFQKQEYFANKFDKINKGLNHDYTKLNTAQGTSIKFIEIIVMVGIGILFIYSILFITDKRETVLLLSLFVAASYKIVPSVNKIFIAFLNAKTHQYTLDELSEITNYNPSRINYNSKPVYLNKNIELKNISFEYPESSFKLDAPNFFIKKGEKVGIQGQSGSGKTTLINIIIGLIALQKGEILIDGIKVNAENIYSWQKLIGYVKQDPFIFNDSLISNIAVGETPEDFNRDRIKSILNFLNLDSLLNSLPDGLNTNIGEEGSKLSVGQKQRVAIARVLYSDKEVLIFDEVTSNLDKETEHEVIRSILKIARQDKTIIFISHKEEILNTCDKVYRIDNGMVYLEKDTELL
ncbi:MAG: ABC transporter ATP-binding protein [Ignavibacteria bacterium]|nr:ABC transporter ATP-binding protein [Ignavibacteria bacterium]